jgi:hypothetical protein
MSFHQGFQARKEPREEVSQERRQLRDALNLAEFRYEEAKSKYDNIRHSEEERHADRVFGCTPRYPAQGPLSGAAKHPAEGRPSKCIIIIARK